MRDVQNAELRNHLSNRYCSLTLAQLKIIFF